MVDRSPFVFFNGYLVVPMKGAPRDDLARQVHALRAGVLGGRNLEQAVLAREHVHQERLALTEG